MPRLRSSLKQAMADLADAKSKKVWSLIKFIFGGSFLLLGICIYSSTGDIMNAWIYAGIAGIPAAFRSTRDSKREQVRKGVRDALTTDVVDTSFNFFGDILARILAILLLAPITATFSAIKNLFVFIGSFSKIKHAQEVYNHLSAEMDIAPNDEIPQQQQQQIEAFAPAPQAYETAKPQSMETTDAVQPVQTSIPAPSSPSASQSTQSTISVPYADAAPVPKKKNTGLIVGSIVGIFVIAAGVAACVAGAGRPSHVLAALLIAGGFAAMLAGWSFGLRGVVCPHCGAPLYEFPQLPWALPDRCPACGEKIDPPRE